ncbi:MAG: hypothetical protein WCG26_07435, partial [Chloroflexales bacterium]
TAQLFTTSRTERFIIVGVGLGVRARILPEARLALRSNLCVGTLTAMHQPSTIWLLLIITLGAMLLLFGCAGTMAITDGEVAQTAVAQGCWSVDTRPSPLPVTVTQIGVRPTAAHGGAATVTAGSTATARATTTPLPRCTPMPGQTLAPYPTAIPTEPPYPTRPVNAAQPEADGKVVMRLPNAVLSADIAVHMQGSWPVVAAIDIPTLNQGPTHQAERSWPPCSVVMRRAYGAVKIPKPKGIGLVPQPEGWTP